MHVGFCKLLNKTVYYDSDGIMLYGKQSIEGKEYYFKPGSGAVQYGEQYIDGKWYYFEPESGIMQTGLYKLPGKTVCYGPDGAMQYGEVEINGFSYYFKPGTERCKLAGEQLQEQILLHK